MAKHRWLIDPTHSEIEFKVKHLMISTVTGRFKKFSFEVFTDGDGFDMLQAGEFLIETASIDTNNEFRDQHLRSVDFLNVENFPLIQVKGIKFEEHSPIGKFVGELTIRGVTRPLTVNIEYGGTVIDPYGQTKAGFTVDGKISRKDFGLVWNELTELGMVIVGDEVQFRVDLQLIRDLQS